MKVWVLCLLMCLRPLAALADPFAQDIPWLWDRAWRDPGEAGEVALLVYNLDLRGDDIRQWPRRARAVLATGTRVTPVVHVEFNLLQPPRDAARHNPVIRDAVLRAARQSSSGWVQLDYEARPSSRLAFRALVADIRQALPAEVRLSVTALAWWCQGGAWLDGLAADEVVPMFFRMGRDSDRLRRLLHDDPGKLNPRCRNGAIGLARQELAFHDLAPRYARRYWYDYRGWKEVTPWPPSLN